MKYIVLLFLLLNSLFSDTLTHKFGPFIDQQLALIVEMEDTNITESRIEEIILQQDKLYREMFKDVIINENEIFKRGDPFKTQNMTLQRKISLNRRLGNNYAVIRDQALVASHRIVFSSYKLLKRVLYEASAKNIELFNTNLNKAIEKNQLEFSKKIFHYDASILKLQGGGILKEAQNNIYDYRRLVELNGDLIKYLAIYQSEIYTLSKYSSLDMAGVLISIDESQVGQFLNPILKPIGLNAIKLFMILFILLFITLIRRLIQSSTTYLLSRFIQSRTESLSILEQLKPYISYIVIFIITHLIIIVVTDFQPANIVLKWIKVIYSILITLLFFQAANIIALVKLEGLQRHTQNMRKEVINVAIKVANAIIITIGFLFVLHFLGFNLSAILSGLGIGGLAVAFAARETIANLFGTVSILMSNNYSQGDWIAVEDHEGTIVEIGLRDTILRTFDNALITIPNAVLANNNVKNWSKRKVGRRIKMHIGVTYQSDFKDIKKAIDTIKQMLVDHPDIATKKTNYTSSRRGLSFLNDEDVSGVKRTILVYMDQFSASSIDILVYCFSKSVVWSEWLEVKEDVMYKIADILKENNLEFAYPTMTLDMPNKEEIDS